MDEEQVRFGWGEGLMDEEQVRCGWGEGLMDGLQGMGVIRRGIIRRPLERLYAVLLFIFKHT